MDTLLQRRPVRKGNSEGKLPDYVKITGRQRVYEENSKKPFAIRVSLPEQDADAAYKAVLKSAGASQKRDALDRRIISEVKKGLALYKGSVTGIPGIIDDEDDVLNTK